MITTTIGYPGACIIKLITDVINSVAFVKASKKSLTITKALAYYTMKFITVINSFMIQPQAPYPKNGRMKPQTLYK